MSVIEIRGLRKSFGDLEVLRDVNFSVEEGERIVIIGSSGCGKSVFLRSIELLEIPDAGNIFIDGEEITAPGVDIDKIRRKMGMVYQRFNLFSHMTVMENLCVAPIKLLKMPKEDAEKKARDLLATVGLLSKEKSYPSVLSGGQQQRIAICRSLMMDPKVILFDEPTSALDPTMVSEVLAVIRMLAKRNLTMIIVTHEMNFAREVATKVLFFADKGIYEQGTPEKIFDNPEKEKTIAFIRRQKYFHYEVTDYDFALLDLVEMQGRIENFAEKYGLAEKYYLRIQLCCEEIIQVMLQGCYEKNSDVKLEIMITYTEATGNSELRLTCGGKKFDPLSGENFSGDNFFDEDLGTAILLNSTENFRHSYENGINKVKFVIKNPV